MLSFIKGRVVEKEEEKVILECNGIGYEIYVPERILRELPEKEEILLFVKLILRENEVSLVGFSSNDEKRLFELLLTVNGVGTKQATKILSELTTAEIRRAIIEENETLFSSIKGLGSKLASRIILELKDKIRKVQLEKEDGVRDNTEKKKMDVILTLKVLGYSESESKKAIQSISNEEYATLSVEELIKKALSTLVK